MNFGDSFINYDKEIYLTYYMIICESVPVVIDNDNSFSVETDKTRLKFRFDIPEKLI